MRIITMISSMLICLSLCSCNNRFRKEKKPFRVAYHVLVVSQNPHKLLITYTDSCGLVSFYCTKKIWSKNVCLSSEDVASLHVVDVFEPENGFCFLDEEKDVPPEWAIRPIAVRIEHKRKIRLSTGWESVRTSLMVSETTP